MQDKQKESHKKFVLKSYALREAIEEKIINIGRRTVVARRTAKEDSQLPTISHGSVYSISAVFDKLFSEKVKKKASITNEDITGSKAG